MKNLRTLSVAEVMERTGWPRSMVYRLMKAEQLATMREGVRGRYRVMEASLEDYFEKRVKGGADVIERSAPAGMLRAVDLAVLPPDGSREFA